MSDPSAAAQASLFELLRAQFHDSLPLVRCSKATLVHLSHTLEELVLANRLPAMIFAGFQEASHWQQESERYHALAEIVQLVCVFAGGELPPERNASQLHVRLRGDDPLRQEWFLIILAREFAVLLCGLDRAEAAEESLRQFDTYWSFDPGLIGQALDRLEEAVARYRPDRLAALRHGRASFLPSEPSVALIAQFTREMIRYEEALQRSLSATNRAYEAQLAWRDSISQTLVHDLRTPLQSLVMALDILEQSDDYDAHARAATLGIARRTLIQMQELVQMLLDTDQLEAGQLAVQWQPIDVDQLITLALAPLLPLIDDAGLRVERASSPTPQLLWGDLLLLMRVLQNLIGNAVKFTRPGGTISIEFSRDPAAAQVELRVRDTGAGIAPGALPFIFDRYRQAERNDRRGAGLGLYFCRLAVAAHGGSIRADSQLGVGTTISLRLPGRPRV
jgi:signal transduction histidine kinase